MTMDEDLYSMSCDELIKEVKKLRQGIREHRDSSEHALCWYHPQLWNLLPEKGSVNPAVPDWPQFMEGCVRFRRSLDEQLPDVPRVNEEFKKDD